jgi:hypothetical protein
MSTQKRTRCKKGTRKNKKTGNCESVLDHTCAICLDRIISGNVKTKCKHNFHKKCLLGWCKSQRHEALAQCPICRGVINDTCKKIMPYASEEVFRYTTLAGADQKRKTYSLEKIDEFIHNPKFNINVKNQWGKTLLHELSWNNYNNEYFKPRVEYLLKKPEIIVSVDLISELIANKNTEMLALYKKHKKIPKSLKSLV